MVTEYVYDKAKMLTKADISDPYDFKHVSGMDEDGNKVDNLNGLDEKVQNLFIMAHYQQDSKWYKIRKSLLLTKADISSPTQDASQKDADRLSKFVKENEPVTPRNSIEESSDIKPQDGPTLESV